MIVGGDDNDDDDDDIGGEGEEEEGGEYDDEPEAEPERKADHKAEAAPGLPPPPPDVAINIAPPAVPRLPPDIAVDIAPVAAPQQQQPPAPKLNSKCRKCCDGCNTCCYYTFCCCICEQHQAKYAEVPRSERGLMHYALCCCFPCCPKVKQYLWYAMCGLLFILLILVLVATFVTYRHIQQENAQLLWCISPVANHTFTVEDTTIKNQTHTLISDIQIRVWDARIDDGDWLTRTLRSDNSHLIDVTFFQKFRLANKEEDDVLSNYAYSMFATNQIIWIEDPDKDQTGKCVGGKLMRILSPSLNNTMLFTPPLASFDPSTIVPIG
jgi:hypothetical protein